MDGAGGVSLRIGRLKDETDFRLLNSTPLHARATRLWRATGVPSAAAAVLAAWQWRCNRRLHNDLCCLPHDRPLATCAAAGVAKRQRGARRIFRQPAAAIAGLPNSPPPTASIRSSASGHFAHRLPIRRLTPPAHFSFRLPSPFRPPPSALMGYNGAMMSTETENLIAQLYENVSRVVLGQSEAVRLTTVALLAGEHLLLEDVPGVGKTLVGKAMARSVAGAFRRIQFTPDLLPADITGSSLYNTQDAGVQLQSRPDLRQRRAGRRDQPGHAADAKRAVGGDERAAGVGRRPDPPAAAAVHGDRHAESRRVRGDLSAAGKPTGPLPAADSDGLSGRGTWNWRCSPAIAWASRSRRSSRVVSCEQVVGLQEEVRRVEVEDSVNGYLLDIVQATRDCDELHVGVSTRGALALYRAAQAAALVAGRGYVVPDDVKLLAVPVLAHRVITKGYLHGDQRAAVEALIERLVDDVPVPA